MKFNVRNISKCNQRLGVLSEVDGKPGVSIKTPAAMLYTKGGHIPHITHEVFKLVTTEPQILQIPLTGMHSFKDVMQHYEGTISNFVGSKDSLSCLTVQDPSSITKKGHHIKDKMAIWTKSGKVYYDAADYMDVVESFRPDMYFLLSDGDTNMTSAEKRVAKAVSNTTTFYRACLERHRKSPLLKNAFVIAPIAGGYNVVARRKYIEEMLKDDADVGGYYIDGLHNNGPEIEFIDIGKVIPLVQQIVERLPNDKLRSVQGCWNPADVIKLIKLGIDLFDTSYCYVLTERCAAMTFSIDDSDESTSYEINLRDSKYVEDFQPFSMTCRCLACSKYSRAYVHHLLTVRELLGPLLIMIHNIHHYLRFFEKVRQCVEDNSIHAFELLITEQLVNQQKSITPSTTANHQPPN